MPAVGFMAIAPSSCPPVSRTWNCATVTNSRARRVEISSLITPPSVPCPLRTTPAGYPVFLISSRWKHYTATPPANWYATNFNDLFWIEGQAKFGCGTGPTNIITPVPQKQPSYYFRQKFVVTDTNMQELLLSARCSDFVAGVGSPMRIFINGREIPATGIEPVLDGNTDQYYDLTPFLDWIRPVPICSPSS